MQYIGESVINVNLRMNIHGRGESVSKIAISGFKNVCPGSKFTIQMLKKLPGKGFRNDTVDSQILTIDNSMRTIESKNSIKT